MEVVSVRAAVAFLGLLSALQLLRFLQGWDVIVNGVSIPAWAGAPGMSQSS